MDRRCIPLEEHHGLVFAFHNFYYSRAADSERGQDICFADDSPSEGVDVWFKRWNSFHAWLQRSNSRQEFIHSLREDHLKAYTVLADFFDGRYHNGHDPEAIIRANLRGHDGLDSAKGYLWLVADLFVRESIWHIPFVGFIWASLRRELTTEAIRHALVLKVAYSCLVSYESSLCGVHLQPREPTVEKTPCPWELQNSSSATLPFYLWDISQQCTVVVAELPQAPSYTCISHTWGRWESAESITLKGVPWIIPGNTRFDVSTIPQLLKAAGIPTNHVWLDLVCIPQGNYDPARQAEEISKQADIFRGAAACIAWWNDVMKWDNLLAAVTWLSFQYLQDRSGLSFPKIDEYMRNCREAADDTINLFHKVHFEVRPTSTSAAPEPLGPVLTDEQKIELHWRFCCSRPLDDCAIGRKLQSVSSWPPSYSTLATVFSVPDWTTSLWTLQEACLFPSMALASSSFEFLQTPQGLKITLDGLSGLVDLVKDRNTRTSRQLSAPFRYNFESANPVMIILKANERVCSGQRAPAIMSILGATNWYKSRLIEANPEGAQQVELLPGDYPLAFMQEAAEKIGPLFYSMWCTHCSSMRMGGLLPFFNINTSRSQWEYFDQGILSDQGVCKYPDHDLWRISFVDNIWTVHISAAVIVASSTTSESRARAKQTGTADGPVLQAEIFGMSGYGEGYVDLQQALDTICESAWVEGGHAFAVLLAQNCWAQIGIILSGVPSIDGWLGLRKMAVYLVKHTEEETQALYSRGEWPEIPKAQPVRWLVM